MLIYKLVECPKNIIYPIYGQLVTVVYNPKHKLANDEGLLYWYEPIDDEGLEKTKSILLDSIKKSGGIITPDEVAKPMLQEFIELGWKIL